MAWPRPWESRAIWPGMPRDPSSCRHTQPNPLSPMNSQEKPGNPKPDGAVQKRSLIHHATQTVAELAGCPEGDGLPADIACVAAAAYHYSVGVFGSTEIAGRVRLDREFEVWRRNGAPSSADIARVREQHRDLLRQAVIELLNWSWKVPLRSTVTGEATDKYAQKVVAGRSQQFLSRAEVAADADRRIHQAIAADLG